MNQITFMKWEIIVAVLLWPEPWDDVIDTEGAKCLHFIRSFRPLITIIPFPVFLTVAQVVAVPFLQHCTALVCFWITSIFTHRDCHMRGQRQQHNPLSRGIILSPLLCVMSQVDTLTEPSTTVHVTSIELQFNSSKFLHDVACFLPTIKITALVAHRHSDSCTSRSCLISNYSTALVQEEQECNWQRWWLQVFWSLQCVQKGYLKVERLCVEMYSRCDINTGLVRLYTLAVAIKLQ